MNNMPYQIPNFVPYPDQNFSYQQNQNTDIKRQLEQIERELEHIERRLTNIENSLKEKNNIYTSNVVDTTKGLYML